MRGARSANTASATGAPGIMTALIRPSSMQEMPFAGEDHRESELVGPLDHDVVAHCTAGLHHHCHPGRGRRLDAVGEGIERVARACAADSAARRLLGGDLTRLDAVLLPGSDAD